MHLFYNDHGVVQLRRPSQPFTNPRSGEQAKRVWSESVNCASFFESKVHASYFNRVCTFLQAELHLEGLALHTVKRRQYTSCQ